MHLRHTAVAAGLALLALPAGAQAATKDVSIGAGNAKGAPKDALISGFFPKTVTIRTGDSVRWNVNGFGVVHLPKKGANAPAFLVTDPSKPVSGVNDAAGQPFSFNGQPSWAPNPAVLAPTKSGGAYTGASAKGSGLAMSDGPPKPWVARFTKPGTYTYYDAVHPGVTGTVKVVAKSKRVPSAKADRARAASQVKTAVAAANALARQKAPANTIVAGPDKGAVDLFRFTPAAAAAKVGQPVTLTMSKDTAEYHTFTFTKDLAATAKLAGDTFFGPVLAPQFAFASDAGDVLSYDGTNHGDGFLNTGILGGGKEQGIPQAKKVVFTKPGTFSFLCAIHPDMQGRVTVTE
ncbi:hypothetical protein [Conexibacter sp. SYSU D00693]|uniref:cupredoxin domain-containing protein n=1 Tax=Conexibacter sp. SYSU D00693 TaxID=2812560 RepID=UPI00196AD410|nr:hypothetical protein [Conexibacter sp. SYSU D00693]